MAIEWSKYLDTKDTEPLPPGLSPPVNPRPTLDTEPPRRHALPRWFTTALEYFLGHFLAALRAFQVSCVREALQGIEAERSKPAAPKRLVDTKEMAEILGVHPAWLRTQAKAGRLPAIRTGRCFRFDPDLVREALERQAKGGEGHGHR